MEEDTLTRAKKLAGAITKTSARADVLVKVALVERLDTLIKLIRCLVDGDSDD